MGKDFAESTRFIQLRLTTEPRSQPESPIVEKVRKIESSFVVNVLRHLLEMNVEKGKMMLGH